MKSISALSAHSAVKGLKGPPYDFTGLDAFVQDSAVRLSSDHQYCLNLPFIPLNGRSKASLGENACMDESIFENAFNAFFVTQPQ